VSDAKDLPESTTDAGAATDSGASDGNGAKNDGATNDTGGGDSKYSGVGELRDLLRHFAQPVIESLDARLRTQVDARVDERVDETVDAALADRLAVIERAVADLDRAVRELKARLDAETDG
jgi:hypothetical protein